MDVFIETIKQHGLKLIGTDENGEELELNTILHLLPRYAGDTAEQVLEQLLDIEQELHITDIALFKKVFKLEQAYQGIPDLCFDEAFLRISSTSRFGTFQFCKSAFCGTVKYRIGEHIDQHPEFYGFSKKEFALKKAFQDEKFKLRIVEQLYDRHLTYVCGDEWENTQIQFFKTLVAAIEKTMEKHNQKSEEEKNEAVYSNL